MPIQTFVIEDKIESWNALVGKHFRKVITIKNYWKVLTIKALNEYKIVPVTSFPCEVSIHCKFKYKIDRDIDSVYFKSCLDQMVKSGIFPDDSLKYIDRVAYSGEIGAKKDQIIVTICTA